MFVLSGKPGVARKSAFSSRVCFATVNDKIIANAVFGFDVPLCQHKVMSMYANCPEIMDGQIYLSDSLYVGPDHQSILNGLVPCNNLNLLDWVKKHCNLSRQEYIKELGSGAYFVKQRKAIVSTVLAWRDTVEIASYENSSDWSVGYVKLNVLGVAFIACIAVANTKRDDRVIGRILNSAFSFDAFNVGYAFDGFPCVCAEGAGDAAYQFIFPDEASPIPALSERASSLRASLIKEKVLDDSQADLCDDIVYNTPDATSALKLCGSACGINVTGDDKDDDKIALLTKWIKVLCRVYHATNARKHVARKDLVVGVSQSAGSNEVVLNITPVSFQFSCVTPAIVDSLLPYIYSPSSSYLKEGVGSDLITAMSGNTFSWIFGLYAPFGQNDPLTKIDLTNVSSGAAEVGQEVNESWKLPLQVNHRETERYYTYNIADDAGDGKIMYMFCHRELTRPGQAPVFVTFVRNSDGTITDTGVVIATKFSPFTDIHGASKMICDGFRTYAGFLADMKSSIHNDESNDDEEN